VKLSTGKVGHEHVRRGKKPAEASGTSRHLLFNEHQADGKREPRRKKKKNPPQTMTSTLGGMEFKANIAGPFKGGGKNQILQIGKEEEIGGMK